MNPQLSGIYVCITELSDESGSCVYNRTGIITQYSPVITEEINFGFLNDNTRWSVTIILIYESGLEIVSIVSESQTVDRQRGMICMTITYEY